MDTTGKRLRWAIKEFGPRPRNRPGAEGSIRGFHGELQELVPEGQGRSYQMLHRYLGDETSPPAAFLEAAAKVLGVRERWLATGEGPPTEQERERRETQAAELVRLVWKELEIQGPIPDEPPFWAGTLAEVWARTGLEERLAVALRQTLAACGLRPQELSPAELGEFVVSMAPAFMTIARLLQEDSLSGWEWVRKVREEDPQEETT